MERTATPPPAILDSWATFRSTRPARESAWLHQFRESGRAEFERIGFPTKRLEEWMYTDVSPIRNGSFRLGDARDSDVVDAATLSRQSFGDAWSSLIVFVNGRFSPRLSHLGDATKGIRVRSLGEVMLEDATQLESWLGRSAKVDGRPFVALNTAYAADGAFISVAPETSHEGAIQILHLSTGTHGPRVSHPRHLVLVAANAKVTIVENYAAASNECCFTNAVTEIYAGANARVTHYRMQRESESSFHVGSVCVWQGAGSTVKTVSVSTGAALARMDIRVTQGGEGTETTLDGLYIARGSQVVDHHTVVDHALPHGKSSEFYKGILDGAAQGVFNGKVIVRPGAQKTDARQNNRNLLLSDDAVIDTKPELEIFADDVKCAHGATIGQLDEDAIFYLRSRGIPAREARDLLTFAFASDVIENIDVEAIRRRLSEFLANRFSRTLGLEQNP